MSAVDLARALVAPDADERPARTGVFQVMRMVTGSVLRTAKMEALVESRQSMDRELGNVLIPNLTDGREYVLRYHAWEEHPPGDLCDGGVELRRAVFVALLNYHVAQVGELVVYSAIPCYTGIKGNTTYHFAGGSGSDVHFTERTWERQTYRAGNLEWRCWRRVA